MIWLLSGALALAAASAAQSGATPAHAAVPVAELRIMCRGESDANPQFRTPSAYALLAELQRARCRMYLLGVAEGIGWSQAGTCTPAPNERERLAGALVEAVLQPSVGPDKTVREIVAAALIVNPPC